MRNITGIIASSILKSSAPLLVSATIEHASPTDIVMVFDQVVTGTNLGFTIGGTTSTTFASISGSGTDTITGVMAVAALGSETVLLSYNDAVGDIINGASQPLASFTDTAVTNNISTLAEGLIVYYKMDEASGATMTDAMGTLNGTYVSGPDYSETGKVDTAILFDLVNDAYADIDTTGGELDFGGGTDSAFSISFWYKPITIGASGHFIINRRDTTNLDWQLAILGGSGIRLTLFDAEVDSIYAHVTQPTVGVWVHFVYTYDGSGANTGFEIYQDGTKKTPTRGGSGTYGSMPDTSIRIRVSARGWEATPVSQVGTLDEIKIWGREITEAEAIEDYDNGIAGDPLL